ncbi:MAG: hypothetical protein WBL54_10085 [Nitrososphaeraceae archaeon]
MDPIVLTSLSVQGATAIPKHVETIDVRGRAIHVTVPQSIGSVTGYHLFIVYTDKKGKQFICQGLPFDPATGNIAPDEILPSDPTGLVIKGQCIPLRPNNRDFIPDAPSITVLSGSDTKQAYNCFFKETDIFNEAKIPYHMVTGPNSNSYTRTMLDKCNILAMRPAVAILTPGWDISINLNDKPLKIKK